MNKIICLFLLAFVVISCTKNNEDRQAPVDNEDSFLKIRGDFDWDWKIEIATFEGKWDCMEASWCTCEINFNNDKISTQRQEDCIPGTIKNFGDINKDGKDDIYVWPSNSQWYWRYPYIMGYIENKWQTVVSSSINVWCEADIKGEIFVIDRNSEPGYIDKLSHDFEKFDNCGGVKYQRERIKFFID